MFLLHAICTSQPTPSERRQEWMHRNIYIYIYIYIYTSSRTKSYFGLCFSYMKSAPASLHRASADRSGCIGIYIYIYIYLYIYIYIYPSSRTKSYFGLCFSYMQSAPASLHRASADRSGCIGIYIYIYIYIYIPQVVLSRTSGYVSLT